jgi:hypothetical protein
MGENQNSVYKHDRMDKNVSFSGATFEFLCWILPRHGPPKKKTLEDDSRFSCDTLPSHCSQVTMSPCARGCITMQEVKLWFVSPFRSISMWLAGNQMSRGFSGYRETRFQTEDDYLNQLQVHRGFPVVRFIHGNIYGTSNSDNSPWQHEGTRPTSWFSFHTLFIPWFLQLVWD